MHKVLVKAINWKISMSILALTSAHEFWKNYDDPMIYRVIAFMETAEKWSLDGNPDLEAAMTTLGDTLESLTSFELGKEEEMVTVCAHIRTSRILRLLQAIDSVDPGSASKVLMYAEENNSPDHVMANLFLRRNIVFERLRLLARIFSEERCQMVLNLLESGHE
jgi:intracellular multiplication protein IcmW